MLSNLGHLRLIFRSHLVEGEYQLLRVVLQPLHVRYGMCVYVHVRANV